MNHAREGNRLSRALCSRWTGTCAAKTKEQRTSVGNKTWNLRIRLECHLEPLVDQQPSAQL